MRFRYVLLLGFILSVAAWITLISDAEDGFDTLKGWISMGTPKGYVGALFYLMGGILPLFILFTVIVYAVNHFSKRRS